MEGEEGTRHPAVMQNGVADLGTKGEESFTPSRCTYLQVRNQPKRLVVARPSSDTRPLGLVMGFQFTVVGLQCVLL